MPVRNRFPFNPITDTRPNTLFLQLDFQGLSFIEWVQVPVLTLESAAHSERKRAATYPVQRVELLPEVEAVGEVPC